VQWGTFTSGNLELKNNILINKMGNSYTGSGYSRANVLYPGSEANFLRITANSNNNILYINDPTKTGQAVRGYHNPGVIGSSSLSLSEMQSVVNYSPRDVNSISKDLTSGFVSSVSPYDLHIQASNWIPFGQGQPTALVTTDIDGNSRSTSIANGPVCIGADEYTPTGSAVTTVDNPNPGDGITQTFTGVDGKKVCTITWTD